MALIGRIRNNSWLLVVVIGLGLASFILMDMFSGQQSFFGSGATEMASIDGRSVDVKELNNLERFYGNTGDPYVRRQSIYNSLVEETLVNNESEAIGLGVGENEMEELLYGTNPSQIIRPFFTNQQTGQLDREAMENFRSGEIPEGYEDYWDYMKKLVKVDRLKGKMNTMVEKGIYTPNWMAEMTSNDASARRDVAIVKVPFDVIDNSTVTLEDADYTTYLNANMAKYESDVELRKVEYVTFPVAATEGDKSAIRKELEGLKSAFSKDADEEAFVATNYGSYTKQWLSKGDSRAALPALVADSLLALSKNTVYGPYLDAAANSYTIAKIVDRQVMPDSAKCRHILISATSPSQFTAAEKTVDSLITVLNTSNISFDTLAARHSTDPGSKDKGGFYDWAPVNQYVPEFNDAVFYSANIGEKVAVRTSYGVHLVEPLGRKGNNKTYLRVAFVPQKIIPSDETIRDVENKAIEFVDANRTSDAMMTAAGAQNLEISTSQALNSNTYNINGLGGGQASRDIVRWAFGNEVRLSAPSLNDVSPEIYSYQNTADLYTDKFVIAALKNIQAPGKPKVSDVKEEIESFVINAKKAEAIKAKINGNTDLNSIAGMFEEVAVDTVIGTTIGGGSITNIGVEPNVQGAIFSTALNTVSAPVEGTSGVFVIKTIKDTPASPVTNLAQQKTSASSRDRSQVKARLIEAMRENVVIEDKRATFF